MKHFIDLNAGWFLYEVEGSRVTVVCDAYAVVPDQHFGPAAWAGAKGPCSGSVVLKATAIRDGCWQQTGPDEFKWCTEDGQEFDEAPPSWPRKIVIEDVAEGSVFGGLAGQIVTSETELVNLILTVAASQPQRPLRCVSAAERHIWCGFAYPQICEDIAIPEIAH